MDAEKRIEELERKVKELEVENDQLESAYIQMEKYALRAIHAFGDKVVWITKDLMDEYAHDIAKVSFHLMTEARANTIQ